MSPKPSSKSPAAYYHSAEAEVAAHAWVQPIVIDDDDLTFGGKSLSAWYEEERRRLSSGSGSGSNSGSDEERRGRERVRRHHHGDGKKSKAHHK